MNIRIPEAGTRRPGVWVAAVPVIVLLAGLVSIIIAKGADSISGLSPYALLGSAGLALVLSALGGSLSKRGLRTGYVRSARQILPAVPILISIALVSTTWMLSGVVPTMIHYGLAIIHPDFFLVTACAVCGIVSVLTGSSWSTIATIGIAFMGIGDVLGYNAAVTAGAVISGAYFGDKMSPLSDTTVVASSTCGVDLFDHIRYMLVTTGPAIGITLGAFLAIGLWHGGMEDSTGSGAFAASLESTFVISPKTLLIPLLTGILIARRVPTLTTMLVSAAAGLCGIFLFQPGILSSLASDGGMLTGVARVLWTENPMTTGNEQLDSLVSTSGITGMIPTIVLVLSAMVFGAVMIGTGMLSVLARTFTRALRRRTSIVGATVGSGLVLNACTADQYLSLIINGNMYRNVYRRFSLEPRLLSRACEDSVSVTSVLIPWNSCGVTQSAVLGVSTLAYLPYCFFNILCPLMSILIARIGYRIPRRCVIEPAKG